jgi:hypothetical protein
MKQSLAHCGRLGLLLIAKTQSTGAPGRFARSVARAPPTVPIDRLERQTEYRLSGMAGRCPERQRQFRAGPYVAIP